MNRNKKFVVWHLCGRQGCGKSTFAAMAKKIVQAHGGYAMDIDAHTFTCYFEGNPERVFDEVPQTTVLMIEDNTTPSADAAFLYRPRHYMRGDRVIDLSDYLSPTQRRPEAWGLVVRALLKNPSFTAERAMDYVKQNYERLAALSEAA